jgi:hypothetical protein
MTFPGDSSNLPQDCALARSFCSQSLFRRFLCAQREIFPSAFFEDNFRVAPPLMMGLTNKHERKTAEPAHTTSPCANSSIRCANKIHSAIYRACGWMVLYLMRFGRRTLSCVRAHLRNSNNTLIIIVALRSGVCKVTAHRAVVNVGGL